MKPKAILLLTLMLLITLTSTELFAQSSDSDRTVTFSRRNMGGPRLGITYVFGDTKLSRSIDRNRMGRQLSQFGWHFEYQVIPEGNGPQFIVQFTPLVAGVEYGKFIPGGTVAMGVRFPSGWEFGLGPNVVATTDHVSPTSLVVAFGKSLDYGGVSIPLNLVYATNPDGHRVSFLIGYAIAKPKHS
jgi:hypothetical protein